MKKSGKKKSSKKWIAAVIAAVLIAGLAIFIINTKKKVEKTLETLTQVKNAGVSTMTLTKSIGATGTVKSVNKKDISAALTGAKVEDIKVSVGDYVSEGDLLMVFESADIEEKLETAKISLENAKKQSSISSSSANRSYNDTKRNADYSIDTARTQLENAEKNYNNTVNDLEEARAQLAYYEKMSDLYKINITNGEKSLKDAKEAENAANTAYSEAVTAYTVYTAQNGIVELDPGYITVKETRDNCEQAFNDAQAQVVMAENQLTLFKSDYQKYMTECSTWEGKVRSCEASVDSLKATYETQKKAYENTVAAQNSAVQSAAGSLEASKISQSTATDSFDAQIETYEEQLKNCKVYAPFSGIITAVNCEKGSVYAGGTVMTVQDCSEYIIETEITEYEISDIAKGQNVLIKTNATGDEVMNGKVIFVSPVSSQSSSMGSASTPSYKVKISIEDASDRLRLDMSASLSIIIEQHENAMVVPYNAVADDEDGRSYVIKLVNGTPSTVYVDVVLESNYYTEISSSELSDGDELLIIDQSDGNDLYRMMMGQRGDF